MHSEIESVRKALFILSLTRRVGWISNASLAKQPGWNGAQASRYLNQLANAGWLARTQNRRFAPGPELLPAQVAPLSIGNPFLINNGSGNIGATRAVLEA